MKTRIVMILMAVVLIALPIMAQQQEWKSTSTMQGAGSSYAPQISAVGATTANEMATTTESYSAAKAPGGPRKDYWKPGEYGQDEESPIGDALLPLILCAAVFCGVIALRRKRSALSR
ncbi:MAG: hypothetical protein IKM83_07130 [Paludibacteraceae bacterium]|nr:hypothetical protein [Paludibacteraceae bacterium]